MKLLRPFIIICCLLILAIPAESGPPASVLRVAVSKSPLQILEIPLEEYLLGVLAGELPHDWPEEALKAQAVAARTYALYRKQHPQAKTYDITSDVNDQAFRLREDYPRQFISAVQATRGETLWWQGHLIPAFFHSCCGGRTEQAAHVWKWANKYPFYEIKEDPFCKKCPDGKWEFEVTKDEMTFLLQTHRLASGQVDHIIPYSSDKSHRMHEVAIITDAESVALTSNRFRQLIGYGRVRSTAFNVLEQDDRFVFIGAGHGHGVGLCQWGARGMSEQGKSYREILQFYYPGVEVKKTY
jgi:stage II sporulation protein D